MCAISHILNKHEFVMLISELHAAYFVSTLYIIAPLPILFWCCGLMTFIVLSIFLYTSLQDGGDGESVCNESEVYQSNLQSLEPLTMKHSRRKQRCIKKRKKKKVCSFFCEDFKVENEVLTQCWSMFITFRAVMNSWESGCQNSYNSALIRPLV